MGKLKPKQVAKIKYGKSIANKKKSLGKVFGTSKIDYYGNSTFIVNTKFTQAKKKQFENKYKTGAIKKTKKGTVSVVI